MEPAFASSMVFYFGTFATAPFYGCGGGTVSKLARRLGKTNQAFGQKLKRGTFTVDEMKEVAAAVDCKYEGAFILTDGEKITY